MGGHAAEGQAPICASRPWWTIDIPPNSPWSWPERVAGGRQGRGKALGARALHRTQACQVESVLG
jgi:hypothetical protein